ncbi:proline-rich protein 36-like isoform X2 [Cervus canadensis]|uniref:proline-rich protein 36-like isoform X2 n=1 Tax=Cervus canadensis TaxID=1574408 RepID=UPI001CA3793D|nr:proline-rich protein 36-like isoform X2 [Cervus canadensis]
MAVVLRRLLLLLCLAASSAALLATSVHSSCPGPLAHTVHSTFMFAAAFAPLCGLASPRIRTRRLAHPLPPTELARLLALVFPSRSGRSGAENRSTGDPETSGVAHRLRTSQRSAPETRLASSSALSTGRPPTPALRLVDFAAAPYNRSRVSTWNFLLHQGQLLTHRESFWDSCPRPANLTVGSLQSRGQPQTSGRRLLCRDPPRTLKTKVPLDSKPGKGQPLMHTGILLAPTEPGGPTPHLTVLECPQVAGQAPSQGQPFCNIWAVACSLSRVPTLDAPLSRRLPLTSTSRPLGARQLGEPKSKVSGPVSPQDKGPPSYPAESAPADPCPPPTKLPAVEAPLSQGPSRRSRQKPIDPHLLMGCEAGVCTEHSLVSREQQSPHSKSPPKLCLPAQPPSNLSAPDSAFGGGLPLACPENATCARPPAFSSPFIPKVGSPLSQGKPPAHKEAHLHLHSPADPPSKPSNTDPSPPQGQQPVPKPPHSGHHPHARWKPSPELSLNVPRVLVCLWPSVPLLGPRELAGRGCYLVEEKYLIPVIVRPTSERSSQKQRPEPAECENGGLGTLQKPPGNLGPHQLPVAPGTPQPPEREGPAPAAPYPQQQFNHSVRLAGDWEMGTEEPPGSKEARHPHPGRSTPRPLAQAGLGLPPLGPGRRLSVQSLVVALSLGDRLRNASASWPALGAVQGVVPLVGLSAEVLLGRGPGDLWPGTRFSWLFWFCVSWGVLIFWRILSGGREGCPAFEQEKLEELSSGIADAKQGTRGLVPVEPQAPRPQAPRTEDSLAELRLLKDRFSHLEEEMEALQEHAEHLGRQEARVRELEAFFLTVWSFLEACAPGQVHSTMASHPCAPQPQEGGLEAGAELA